MDSHSRKQLNAYAKVRRLTLVQQPIESDVVKEHSIQETDEKVVSEDPKVTFIGHATVQLGVPE